MSRIGKKIIPVPKGVSIDITGSHVKVSGPKGMLERDISPAVELTLEAAEMTVQPRDEGKKTVALQGLTRTLIHNMVVGVETGFKKKLLIEGVGYKAEATGARLTLNVGYSNPVQFQLPDGVTAEVDKSNAITLSAIDKELLGLTAARIRQVRKPEPYKGKGIRYENEHIVRKVGKSGTKG